jgi:enoyl-CoA hydratase/carnithine racemase
MDIVCQIRNRIAFITLNRPEALNALSLPMIVELREALDRFAEDSNVRAVFIKGAGEKAFCAGGDIRALYESYRNSGTLHLNFFSVEYPLDYQLHFYPKPYLVLMDGIAMGGGMGIAQGSRMRIVGDRTRMAMPEVGIGFFPDVGASYFLSRLPGSLGIYLALTGIQVRAADALYAGLADAYLPRAGIERLESELIALEWSGDRSHAWSNDINRVIGQLASSELSSAPLAALRESIDQHFSARSVPAVLKSLANETRSANLDWATQTLALINTRSPTMLAVTLMQLQRGKSMSLADCLRMEAGMARQCFVQGDFIEGIRAVLIDKDNKPRWRPDSVAEVTEASLEAIFDDPWAGAAHPLENLGADHS